MKNGEKSETGGRRRAVLAAATICAGCVWFVLFPKRASLDTDMVASVAIGIGLVGPGVLLLFERRLGRLGTALAILLLWSVLANAVLYSEATVLADLLSARSERAAETR